MQTRKVRTRFCRALATACTVFTICVQTVSAQERAPNPQADFGQYDCDIQRDHETRHVGQHLQGQYVEWLESYGPGENVRNVFCVTILLLGTSALSREDAENHYLASSGISTRERPQAETFQTGIGRIIENPVIVPEVPLGKVRSPDTERERERSSGLTEQNGMSLPDIPAPPEEFELHSGTVMQGRLLEIDPTGTSDQLYLPGLEQPAPEPAPLENDESAPLQNHSGSTAIERPLVDDVDDRERVTDTSSFPWNVISILYVGFEDGTYGRCTGTLISPYAILTAAHCVHNQDWGGYAQSMSAAPGQGQPSFSGPVHQPYGEEFARFAVVPGHWKRISSGNSHPTREFKSDYAVILFDESWDFTNTFMPVVFDDTGEEVTNAGYPAEVQGNSNNLGMWRHSGTEIEGSISDYREYQVRAFTIDSSGGNSGGPFFVSDGTNRELTGILSFGSDDEERAGGPWMGGDNEGTIRSWINWTPRSSLPLADKAATHIPLVFGTESNETQSFLRFYNASESSGEVRVTLSNRLTGEILDTWRSPTIEPDASQQFDIARIEEETSIEPESVYAVGVESEFTGYVQHVIWNQLGVSLTNLTACEAGLSNDVITITNFHSSLLSDGYESYLYFHNVSDESADIIIDFRDAATGDWIGGIRWSDVPPGVVWSYSTTQLESSLNEFYDHEPSDEQYHYNLRIRNDFPGYLHHVVHNSEAGLFTNMSAKCSLRATDTPAQDFPDLVVQSVSVSDNEPDADASFTLSATVRNQGSGGSAATTLRYYRSSNATISSADTEVGTDAVGGLAASGSSRDSIRLNAPETAGTYYYGACVDAVSEESDTGNNCSDAVSVTVRPVSTGGRYGAFTYDFPSCAGLAAGIAVNHRNEQEALDAAIQDCQSDGGSATECRANTRSFEACGALAYGTSADSCKIYYRWQNSPSTLSAIESQVLSNCRSDGRTGCRIWTNGSAKRIAACNSQSNNSTASAERAGESQAGRGAVEAAQSGTNLLTVKKKADF